MYNGFSWENPKVLNKDILWEVTNNKSHLSKVAKKEKLPQGKHQEIGKHWEIRKNFNEKEAEWEVARQKPIKLKEKLVQLSYLFAKHSLRH